MEERRFGTTDLRVSLIGAGTWGIGGPAVAGTTPIGWGEVDDRTSIAALERACDRGVTFFDTADFYGLGHSEELLGRALGNRPGVVIATKVGHRKGADGAFTTDYSGSYIQTACELSLRRLRRERIDFYQLHSARLGDLERGECAEAMELLRAQGKVRAWGISLNTFRPAPEAEYIVRHRLVQGFQLVLNIINQRAVPLLEAMQDAGYGVLARMPLQFGLLTGKFTPASKFAENDHRSFRLRPEILAKTLAALETVWPLAEKYGTTPTGIALAFCASFPQVSTIIPGIRTPAQAVENTAPLVCLSDEDVAWLTRGLAQRWAELMEVVETGG